MNSQRNLLRLAGGAALMPFVAQAAAARPAGLSSMADYFPNVVRETHEGRKVRFSDDLIKGKVVAINMMYSICTGICPTGTANPKQVQQALDDRCRHQPAHRHGAHRQRTARTRDHGTRARITPPDPAHPPGTHLRRRWRSVAGRGLAVDRPR
jgi:hypothetical protein